MPAITSSSLAMGTAPSAPGSAGGAAYHGTSPGPDAICASDVCAWPRDVCAWTSDARGGASGGYVSSSDIRVWTSDVCVWASDVGVWASDVCASHIDTSRVPSSGVWASRVPTLGAALLSAVYSFSAVRNQTAFAVRA